MVCLQIQVIQEVEHLISLEIQVIQEVDYLVCLQIQVIREVDHLDNLLTLLIEQLDQIMLIWRITKNHRNCSQRQILPKLKMHINSFLTPEDLARKSTYQLAINQLQMTGSTSYFSPLMQKILRS